MAEPRIDEQVWREVAFERRPLPWSFVLLAVACVLLPLLTLGANVGGLTMPRLAADSWGGEFEEGDGTGRLSVDLRNDGWLPVTVTGVEVVDADGRAVDVGAALTPTVVPARGAASLPLDYRISCVPGSEEQYDVALTTTGTWPWHSTERRTFWIDLSWCPAP